MFVHNELLVVVPTHSVASQSMADAPEPAPPASEIGVATNERPLVRHMEQPQLAAAYATTSGRFPNPAVRGRISKRRLPRGDNRHAKTARLSRGGTQAIDGRCSRHDEQNI